MMRHQRYHNSLSEVSLNPERSTKIEARLKPTQGSVCSCSMFFPIRSFLYLAAWVGLWVWGMRLTAHIHSHVSVLTWLNNEVTHPALRPFDLQRSLRDLLLPCSTFPSLSTSRANRGFSTYSTNSSAAAFFPGWRAIHGRKDTQQS